MNDGAGAENPVVLVADIGGTHVRFGLADGEGAVRGETTLDCADFPDPAAAAEHYLESVAADRPPVRAVFAIASPIAGDRIEMTNHLWSFSVEETRRRLDLSDLRVVNDFTALALALPVLRRSDTRSIKPGQREPEAPMALLGPGTGLGVSGLIPVLGRWWPLSSEGGHRDLAPSDEHEWRVVQALQQRLGHVSAERALSGPGLVALYRALCDLSGLEPEELTPRDVEQRARRSSEGPEAGAVRMFSGWLGAFAGDLALTLGARGGVFLAGGILPKMNELFDEQRFVQRFLDKGRFRSYLEPIPVELVLHRTAALLGAARVLDLDL